MKKNRLMNIKLLFFCISYISYSASLFAGEIITEPLGKSGQHSPVEINFNQPGAVYHAGESGKSIIKINQSSVDRITVELLDTDHHLLKKKSFKRQDNSEFIVEYPFKLKTLGYYYIKVIPVDSSSKIQTQAEEGFGVIPNVTLMEKDWDSPFGICGHYQRYKDWRIGAIQRKLGIAWVRDEADWHRVISQQLSSDPYLDYLDSHHLCWLALFNYVNSFNGIQGADSIWRWNKDVSFIRQYVQMNKGRINVYESQNEPNNFGGWSKRWPHPQNQQWRPQGWGKPFADLIKQMRDSIRTVDPSIKLMWPGEDEWIEYFVHERGAAPYIDITSIHPYVNAKKYPETESFASGRYTEHKKELQQMNVPTEMWVTEVGWTTYIPSGKPNRYVPVTEYEQAAFLVRTYLLHLYRGAKKVFWYEMTDEPFGKENPESYFGIVRYNTSLTVKPSAVAFSNMIHNYRYAIPVGEYVSSPEVYGFAYTCKGTPQLCLWREKDNREEVLTLKHTRKVELTDIFGRKTQLKVVDGQVRIPLSIYPLTIRGIDKEDFQKLYIPKT